MSMASNPISQYKLKWIIAIFDTWNKYKQYIKWDQGGICLNLSKSGLGRNEEEAAAWMLKFSV